MAAGLKPLAKEVMLVAGSPVFQRQPMKHVLSIYVLILPGAIPSKRVTVNDIGLACLDEVVALLGKLSRVSAKGNVEHLYHNESALTSASWELARRNDKREYEMRFIDGKVASFARRNIDEDDGSDSDN